MKKISTSKFNRTTNVFLSIILRMTSQNEKLATKILLNPLKIIRPRIKGDIRLKMKHDCNEFSFPSTDIQVLRFPFCTMLRHRAPASGWSTVRNCRETPASATSAPAPPGIIIGVGKDKSGKRNANVQYALCPCFSPLVIHARSYFFNAAPFFFSSHSSQLCYPSYVLMFKLPRPVSFRNFFCPAYLLRGREGGGVLKRERNLFARTCSFLFCTEPLGPPRYRNRDPRDP